MSTPQHHTPETPEDRAEAAARDLADRGHSVTARAVRDEAGVRMAVAADAARAWKEAASEQTQLVIPEVPADVTGRLSAIWADAYRAAVAAVSPERDRFALEIEELRAEVEALTGTVEEVESERDDAIRQRDDLQREQQVSEERRQFADKQLREATQTLSNREATITELREQTRTLSSQLDAIIARIPAEPTK